MSSLFTILPAATIGCNNENKAGRWDSKKPDAIGNDKMKSSSNVFSTFEMFQHC